MNLMQYVFILGRNSALSAAEVQAVFPEGQLVAKTDAFLILALTQEIDCRAVLDHLGGTIKIGQIVALEFSQVIIVEDLKKVDQAGKINFGISFYGLKTDNQVGLEIKKELKQSGINCRLVVSREPVLSSVVISKNKCHEFIVAKADDKIYLAKTFAVQDFDNYSKRDFGRPSRDLVSGSLPPKLAQIMINLAQVDKSKVLVDPFCGSGTIFQEAILMGYKNIVGSDISSKAIEDSRANLEWLEKNLEKKIPTVELFNCPVQDLASQVKRADAIVTEPFLGPAQKGSENIGEVIKIVSELEQLYLEAFGQFDQVLNHGGRVVIVFPYFKKFELGLKILSEIKKMGFTQVNNQQLIYSRPDQKIWRQIFVFEKQ